MSIRSAPHEKNRDYKNKTPPGMFLYFLLILLCRVRRCIFLLFELGLNPNKWTMCASFFQKNHLATESLQAKVKCDETSLPTMNQFFVGRASFLLATTETFWYDWGVTTLLERPLLCYLRQRLFAMIEGSQQKVPAHQ